MDMRLLTCLVGALAACGSNSPVANPMDLAVATDLAASNPLVAARPYQYEVPSNYDSSHPTPLILLLHAYSLDGAGQNTYFGFDHIINQAGFLLAYPDGTLDKHSFHYWYAANAGATPGAYVDDVAYLTAVIDDMSAHYNVDPQRIYVVGHSNGAFMAHHLACRIGDRLAAVLTLAGENWVDPAECPAGAGLSLADVHGDADGTINYNGGTLEGLDYLGARASTQVWAARGGCPMTTDTSAPPINVDSSLPGNETAIERWTGCPNVDVELWTVHGGDHIPALTAQWPTQVWNFLSAHPKS